MTSFSQIHAEGEGWTLLRPPADRSGEFWLWWESFWLSRGEFPSLVPSINLAAESSFFFVLIPMKSAATVARITPNPIRPSRTGDHWKPPLSITRKSLIAVPIQIMMRTTAEQ
eukprot:GHVN01007903.1.p2 GENE.GHVN01007903.1~~GHVN01007903.1.p2  ORF type:complete len:113 (+),score=8.33 GHVN01007903.1:1045-1383(+)